MSEFSNLSYLKLLRSVDLLSRLTILQLSHIADSLSEVSFSEGQTIVSGVRLLLLRISFTLYSFILCVLHIYLQNEGLVGLYIIQKGKVRITFDANSVSSPVVSSLNSENKKEDDNPQSSKELSVEKTEGSYFGEWVLLGEHIDLFSAVAMGDVVCAVLTKEKFDSVVGPLTKLSQDDQKYVAFYRISVHNF